jgi:hypothetical protein
VGVFSWFVWDGAGMGMGWNRIGCDGMWWDGLDWNVMVYAAVVVVVVAVVVYDANSTLLQTPATYGSGSCSAPAFPRNSPSEGCPKSFDY